MDLANYLVKWTTAQHPVEAVRNALSGPPILPAPPGDPQPNPPDDPAAISLDSGKLAPQDEVNAVARAIQAWLPSHQEYTVAILTSTNDHAAKMVKALQARGLECLELLRSTSPTRAVAGALSHVLGSLSDPASPRKLGQAYRVWRRDWRRDKARQLLVDRVAGRLETLKRVEGYISPPPSSFVLGALDPSLLQETRSDLDLTDDEVEAVHSELEDFRGIMGRWHAAIVLPIDQLVLTLAQDIFTEVPDLALAHKLALVMAQLAQENPQWRLPELTPRLNEIARNERKFIGFSADDSGFNPDAHKGKVVVSTMHKAKGLEWDRVYLLSVNNYDFPSAQSADRFISEKWFLRDALNLEAEALAQLEAAISGSEYDFYEEGEGTRRARLDYARERLRLLYVGITRARKELIITWNTGRRGEALPAIPLAALQAWWSSRQRANTS
jgi:DNA helicase-2/ATP-dependent DNA helicase PcrA